MTKIHIDHEAAKRLCEARILEDIHPSRSDRNLAGAYLDLQKQIDTLSTRNLEAQHRAAQENSKLREQLAAERTRVEAMREAWDKWMATPSSDNDTWQWETDEWHHLTGIMETRDDAHAQGEVA